MRFRSRCCRGSSASCSTRTPTRLSSVSPLASCDKPSSGSTGGGPLKLAQRGEDRAGHARGHPARHGAPRRGARSRRVSGEDLFTEARAIRSKDQPIELSTPLSIVAAGFAPRARDRGTPEEVVVPAAPGLPNVALPSSELEFLAISASAVGLRDEKAGPLARGATE